MKDQIILLFMGSAIGMAASYIVGLWRKNYVVIEQTLTGLDDALEKRLNIDIPDEIQAAYHAIIHGSVAYVNRFAGDARFWREIIRAVIAKDPSKATLLQQEILSFDWSKPLAAIEEVMSPDLKALYNQTKEDLAVKVATANIATSGVAPSVLKCLEADLTKAEVRTVVRVVAPGVKPIEGPVTKDVLERMIRESIERQNRLRGTGEKQ